MNGSRPFRFVIRNQPYDPAPCCELTHCSTQFSHIVCFRLAHASRTSKHVCALYPVLHSMIATSSNGNPIGCTAVMSPCWPNVFFFDFSRCVARPPDDCDRQNTSSCFPFVHHNDNSRDTSRSNCPPFRFPFPIFSSVNDGRFTHQGF